MFAMAYIVEGITYCDETQSYAGGSVATGS
jgi:hypothetical protein